MAESPMIRVFSSLSELIRAATEEMASTINRAIGARGICFVALSGGKTPRPVYHMLGSAPLRNLIEWRQVHIYFVDERVVPPDHPESNFGMVERELLSQIPISPENVHRIVGENDPHEAARDYERVLQSQSATTPVRFDLILLGLGEDGHTASLFPGSDDVTAEGALVRAIFVPKLNSWRVTLTLECINHARRALFLVEGQRKASVVRMILSMARPTTEMPASLVNLSDGEVVWMLDKDAAGSLGPKVPR